VQWWLANVGGVGGLDMFSGGDGLCTSIIEQRKPARDAGAHR